MEMQGSRHLGVTQQQAWEALNDPEVLKACIAGCEKIESTGENQYAVAMAVRIGPVAAKFSGKIALSDIRAPEGYSLAFDGSGGAAGFGKGNAKVSLAAENGGCLLSYDVTAQVGGKIAQLGQRLVDGAARSMAEDFFRRFDDEMQRRHPAPVVAGMPSGAAAPVAGPLARVPSWAWAAGAIVVLVGLWLGMR